MLLSPIASRRKLLRLFSVLRDKVKEEYNTVINWFYCFSRERVLRANDKYNNGRESVPFTLVGNKADLTKKRKVTAAEAESKASEWGVPYVETSALKRNNIDKASDRKSERILDCVCVCMNDDGVSHSLCHRCFST